MSLPAAPGPHPSADELRRALAGPRTAADERVLEHAALCARCAEEEYRIDAFRRPEPVSARELEAAWRRLSGGAPRRPALWRPLALAASLLLAVGAVLVVSQRRPRMDVVRGGGAERSLVSPSGTLDAPPSEFVFTPGAPVRVRVVDASRAYEWTSAETSAGRVAFPPEEREKLRPGVEYVWTLLGADAAAQNFRIRR